MSKRLQFQLHVKSRIGNPNIAPTFIQYAAPQTIKLETEKISDVKTGVMIAKCKPDGCVMVSIADEYANKIAITNNIFGSYYKDELKVRLSNTSGEYIRIDQDVKIFKYQWVSSRLPITTSKKTKVADKAKELKGEVAVTSAIGVYNKMPVAQSEFAPHATEHAVPEQINTTIIQENEKNNFHNIVISEETTRIKMDQNNTAPTTTTVTNPTFASNQPANDGLAKAGFVAQNSQLDPTVPTQPDPNSATPATVVPIPLSHHSGETFIPVDGGATTTRVHDAVLQNSEAQQTTESRYAQPAQPANGEEVVETDLSSLVTPQQGHVVQNSELTQNIPEETTSGQTLESLKFQQETPQSSDAPMEQTEVTGAPVQQVPIAEGSEITEPVVQPREGQSSVNVETFIPNVVQEDSQNSEMTQATPVVQSNPPQNNVTTSANLVQHDTVDTTPQSTQGSSNEINPIQKSEDLVQPSQDAQELVQQVQQPTTQTQQVVTQQQAALVDTSAPHAVPIVQSNPPQDSVTANPNLVIHDGGGEALVNQTVTRVSPASQILETNVVETEVEEPIKQAAQQDQQVVQPQGEEKTIEETSESVEVSGDSITGAQPDIAGMPRKKPVRRTVKKRIEV